MPTKTFFRIYGFHIKSGKKITGIKPVQQLSPTSAMALGKKLSRGQHMVKVVNLTASEKDKCSLNGELIS